MKDYSKRDSSIELARIIGCLIVIGCHTLLSYERAIGFDHGRLFLAMVFADGVAIFWIISGAFLYNSKDYATLLKKVFKSVVIPMTVTGVIVFFFGNWILGYSSLTDSINHSKCDYLMFIHNLLRMDNVFTGMPHYWYLYEYLFLILAFPLLKSFVDYIEVNIKRTSLFLIISFVLVLVNDITANELFEFSHHSINGFMPAALLSIWGHILYKNRDYIKRWHSACAVVIFLLANISRYFVQTKRYYTGNVSIMSWYSSVGLICSMCVVCFCLSLMKGKKRENCFVNYISSYTLGIYLIHILVCNYLSVKKITEWIMNRTCNRFDSFFGELLYQFMIIVTVFGFCVAILLIIRVIKYLTYNCLNIIKSLILKEKQGNE